VLVESTRTYLPMKIEQTECSETSEYKIHTLGNLPKESIQHSGHGESLKSGKLQLLFMCFLLRICSENRQSNCEVTCGR